MAVTIDEGNSDAGDTTIIKVRQATARRVAANEEAEQAEVAWQGAIRAAIKSGCRIAEIAKAAGVSRERIYQIRDSRR